METKIYDAINNVNKKGGTVILHSESGNEYKIDKRDKLLVNGVVAPSTKKLKIALYKIDLHDKLTLILG